MVDPTAGGSTWTGLVLKADLAIGLVAPVGLCRAAKWQSQKDSDEVVKMHSVLR